MRNSSLEKIAKIREPFPEKLFYKIGEVSRIAGIESYVLRYWETEFPFLKPRKSKSGQRVYTRKDIDAVLQIRRLLYEERYTIEGVRKRFGEFEPAKQTKTLPQSDTKEIVAKVKKRLRDILGQIR